nr:MAG TPA: hypothetical protein [Bacteriophage sp.]DAI57861.1 MAG TPA: hypothetical protein [Caudoviricetes sp.]
MYLINILFQRMFLLEDSYIQTQKVLNNYIN